MPEYAAAPVAIVGGGPSGMALALALHRVGIAATVFDARPRNAAGGDQRVLALAHGTRLTLETLGVWSQLPATPIETIHVSQRGGFGRTRLTASEQGVPALGYVVGAGPLANALDAAMQAAGIVVRERTRVVAAQTDAGEVRLTLDDGETAPASLVAWAEGAIDDDQAARSRDYGQDAVICNAETDEAHGGVAYERFTPDGPLALLPQGRGWSVVFTAPRRQAQQLAAIDDAAFLARLQEQFGNRLRFTGVGPRHVYPLWLRIRREPVGPRQAWLGNAAQTIHPVSGQGFNLALRDAWELARQAGRGADPGAQATLAAYARARKIDRGAVIRFTDTLVHLFSNDFPPLRQARGLGLLALDLLPPARSFLAKRLMFGPRAWP